MPNSLIGTKQHRQASINPNSLRMDGDKDDRVMEFSVSSETPFDRGGWGAEILDHSPKAIDLSRLNDGAMMLRNHDPDQDIGVVLKAWIAAKKLYVKVKFDSHELAERMYKSVTNGIVRNVSIAYEVNEVESFEGGKNGDYLVTKWQPLEVSFVSIPADHTVGIGRAYSNSNIQIGEKTMNADGTLNDDGTLTEKGRIKSIYRLGKRHNLSDDEVQNLIDKDASIEEARQLVLRKLELRQQQPIAKGASMGNILGLSDQEKNGYSFCRALLSAADPRNKSPELEMSDAIAQKIGKSTRGVYIPLGELPRSRAMSQRATYQVGSPATGGVGVSLDIGNLIEVIREQLVLGELIQFLPGLQGDLDLPRQDGQSSPFWVGESEDITRSESTFDKVALRPKTVGCLSRYSQRMLLQSSFDIEAFVVRDLVSNIAVEIDRVILNGSGSANQPRGILNTTGIGSVALGTNGAALTRAATLETLSQVADANLPLSECCYLINSKTLAHGMGITVDAGSGRFLIEPMDGMPGVYDINGIPTKVTNLLPSNLTKGTGMGLSAMLFGRFSDLHLGLWSVLEVLPNPYGDGYASGDVEVRAMQTLDVGICRESAFSAITDLATA